MNYAISTATRGAVRGRSRGRIENAKSSISRRESLQIRDCRCNCCLFYYLRSLDLPDPFYSSELTFIRPASPRFAIPAILPHVISRLENLHSSHHKQPSAVSDRTTERREKKKKIKLIFFGVFAFAIGSPQLVLLPCLDLSIQSKSN